MALSYIFSCRVFILVYFVHASGRNSRLDHSRGTNSPLCSARGPHLTPDGSSGSRSSASVVHGSRNERITAGHGGSSTDGMDDDDSMEMSDGDEPQADDSKERIHSEPRESTPVRALVQAQPPPPSVSQSSMAQLSVTRIELDAGPLDPSSAESGDRDWRLLIGNHPVSGAPNVTQSSEVSHISFSFGRMNYCLPSNYIFSEPLSLQFYFLYVCYFRSNNKHPYKQNKRIENARG